MVVVNPYFVSSQIADKELFPVGRKSDKMRVRRELSFRNAFSVVFDQTREGAEQPVFKFEFRYIS